MSHGERAAPVRVLVVDDEPVTRACLAEILHSQGFAVTTAGTGADGLQQLQLAGGVELLVLDISLPDMDGPDIAVRAAAIYGARPTIFVTGWVSEFFELGVVPGRWEVLQKPVAIPRLLECIGRLGVPVPAPDRAP